MAERYARINESAPAELRQSVTIALHVGLSGKIIYHGETLSQVVERECPQVAMLAAAEGYSANFDLPENSPKNMARGHLFFTLTPKLH